MPQLSQAHLGRRHTAIAALAASALTALIGCQSIARPTFSTPDDTFVANTASFQRLELQPASLYMPAAVSSGQFEELFTPPAPPVVAPAPQPEPRPQPEAARKPEPAVYEQGIASTYGEGDGFEGNRTACGQIFRTSVVQVAHKSLPCGTLLRVEEVDTGRSVEARVTDR